MLNKTLRAVANRGNFDKGKELAGRTAIEQSKIIASNFSTLKQIDERSKPKGWKVRKFREVADKINRREELIESETQFIDELYELIIGKAFGVPSFKREFYKGFKR